MLFFFVTRKMYGILNLVNFDFVVHEDHSYYHLVESIKNWIWRHAVFRIYPLKIKANNQEQLALMSPFVCANDILRVEIWLRRWTNSNWKFKVLTIHFIKISEQIYMVILYFKYIALSFSWELTVTCVLGFGVDQLRDDNLETYWQSDGSQPHLVNIQFR